MIYFLIIYRQNIFHVSYISIVARSKNSAIFTLIMGYEMIIIFRKKIIGHKECLMIDNKTKENLC